jgi:hypothetical protein
MRKHYISGQTYLPTLCMSGLLAICVTVVAVQMLVTVDIHVNDIRAEKLLKSDPRNEFGHRIRNRDWLWAYYREL